LDDLPLMLVVRFDSHEGEEDTSHHSRQGYDHLCNLSESQVNHPQPERISIWQNLEPIRSTRPSLQQPSLGVLHLACIAKGEIGSPWPKCCGLLILAQSHKIQIKTKLTNLLECWEKQMEKSTQRRRLQYKRPTRARSTTFLFLSYWPSRQPNLC
jgi:hypothetical protein